MTTIENKPTQRQDVKKQSSKEETEQESPIERMQRVAKARQALREYWED